MKQLNEMTDQERKALPLHDGFVAYFPDAMCAVAHNSWLGQQQHAPDEPLQWHRGKSTDEMGSLTRHIIDYAKAEAEGDYEAMVEASASIAWRGMAHLQRLVATLPDDPARYQLAKALREEQA